MVYAILDLWKGLQTIILSEINANSILSILLSKVNYQIYKL